MSSVIFPEDGLDFVFIWLFVMEGYFVNVQNFLHNCYLS